MNIVDDKIQVEYNNIQNDEILFVVFCTKENEEINLNEWENENQWKLRKKNIFTVCIWNCMQNHKTKHLNNNCQTI